MNKRLTIEEKIAHILTLQSPKWEIVKEQYERMCADHRIGEAEIAAWFGYKNKISFKQSSAYRRIVLGIVRVWLRTQ